MTSSKSASRRRRRDREPRTVPMQQLSTAAYDATTITFGGMSAPGLPDADIAAALGGRQGILIGDALALDPEWAGKFANLPCGHCGAVLDVAPASVLDRARVIGHLNWLAANAGWRYDVDLIWTCPPCQQGDAWKARQGQLEVRLDGPPDAKVPPAGTCDRHDLPAWPDVHPDECRCTCPGAVLAVDVMLASEDHLGSGRGRHRAATR